MKKRFVILIVLVVVVIGIVVFSNGLLHKSEHSISRAEVAKMIVLMLESQDNVEESLIKDEYQDVKQEDEYAKYISEAIRLNLITVDSEHKQFYPQKDFTFENAGELLLALGEDTAKFSYSFRSKRAMSRKEFFAMYEQILMEYKEKTQVAEKQVLLLDYDKEKQSIRTSAGEYHNVDGALSDYVGKVVSFYAQNQVFVMFKGIYQESITLSNVWCQEITEKNISFFSNGSFVSMQGSGLETESTKRGVADIVIRNQKIEQLTLKTNQMSGRVISVQDGTVELDNGRFPLHKDAPIYVAFDEVKQLYMKNALMSYERVNLVMDGEEICAIYVSESAQTKQIRVLINTTGFSSKFHDKVTISSEQDYIVVKNGEQETVAAGKDTSFSKDAPEFSNGRIVIKPVKEHGTLTLKSIERGYGNPVYHGSIELSLGEEGIVVVNEVGFETYLYAVVPSEMPVSYGAEALKVQAVCARSFAYANLLESSFSEYGAHLDDSVNSQVYNNSRECEESIAAVDSTSGQVLYAGKKLVTTYFFSTSCGHTGNAGDVWQSGGNTPKYLTGRLQAAEGKVLHLNEEGIFRNFIDDADGYDFFEKDVNWFRWTVTMSKEQIQKAIDTNLAAVLKYVKVKNKNGKYVSREIATIGEFQDMKVQQRSETGVLKSLIITGSEAEIMISSEYGIRKLLGNSEVEITLRDGSRTSQAMLPSGYFYLEKHKDDTGAISQISYNGGGYGHGVGMSQNGVKAMNERGYTLEQMLQYFFPETKLTSIY